jgi:hypothetical protein
LPWFGYAWGLHDRNLIEPLFFLSIAPKKQTMDQILQSSVFSISLLLFAKLAIGVFLAILFLQTGLDKIIHHKGNKAYLEDYFKQSLLAPLVPLMLYTVTMLELWAGLSAAVGMALLLLRGDGSVLLHSAAIGLIALLCLFFGQRVVKDYAGAAGMVPYIAMTLFSMLVLGH